MEETKIIDDVKKLIKNKKFIFWSTIVLIIFVIIFGSWIRLQNLSLLKDATTGEYIPLALDPYYFLRIAEIMVNEGGLPVYDVMRAPAFQKGFSNEILPNVLVFMYKFTNIFGDFSIQYIDVIYPVVFFVLGLIIFFFLVYFLTKSKITALVSSAFLAFIPAYLHRTMAGFADHEAIGMFAFFGTMLIYILALKLMDKKTSLIKSGLFGLFIAFASAFTIASWGGIANFVFMIIPLSFFLFWLVKFQDSEDIKDKKLINQYLLFYIIWIVFSILFTKIFDYDFYSILNSFVLSSNGLISLFVLGFIITDYILILKIKDIKFLKNKFRQGYSFVILIFLGIIGLAGLGKNIFSLIKDIWIKLLHPWGLGRVDLTVAENAQPYLMDWIGQTGKIMFWMFFAGILLMGFEIAKDIESKKNKIWFFIVWVIMVCGILFSRISSNSLLNGTNFISQAFYIIGLILFVGYCSWLYFNDKIKVETRLIIAASWMFWMLIAGRGAIRLLFVVTPFVCFSAGFFVVKISDYVKTNKDEIGKMILWIIFILAILGTIYSLFGFVNSISTQAKYTGPSANIQWQKAMEWVRNETPVNSVFIHWWDYGYWVQYLGERPTVTDGGHATGAFGDHLNGRYVLTTPNPETALSFMKTWNVSYLLIDPTDLGKYPAYSKIGSDKTGNDRYSWIPVLQSDPKQTRETANKTIIIYPGGFAIDEDIIYETEDEKIFLPAQKAGLAGIMLGITKSNNNEASFSQPEGIFFYNGKQINIPLRYIYYNDQLADFKTGLDCIIHIIPKVSQVDIDNFGVAIYLSPKVSKSLFARLYLLNDVFGDYKTLKLAHKEPSPVVESLKNQGLNLNEFIYYQGFRGPIKIWEINYPDNIIAREEFLSRAGEYAEFDNLEFVR